MALLPLRQAADAVGVSRQTLYRYVKDGRLSATVGHDGQKQVDTTELLRVFGKLDPVTVPETAVTESRDSPRQAETAAETVVDQVAAARMEVELASTKAMLDLTRTELSAAKEREAKLLDVVQNQTRLLEYRAAENVGKATKPWPVTAAVVAGAVAVAVAVAVVAVAAVVVGSANLQNVPPPAVSSPAPVSPGATPESKASGD
jgi:AcrR family transcriptional regulator